MSDYNLEIPDGLSGGIYIPEENLREWDDIYRELATILQMRWGLAGLSTDNNIVLTTARDTVNGGVTVSWEPTYSEEVEIVKAEPVYPAGTEHEIYLTADMMQDLELHCKCGWESELLPDTGGDPAYLTWPSLEQVNKLAEQHLREAGI